MSCWTPPAPAADEESKTKTSIEVTAPGDVPEGTTLTLQLRKDEDFSFNDVATNIAASATVPVSGLTACTQYVMRWVAVPEVDSP